MKRLAGLLLLCIVGSASVWPQGKGVDKTSERVRDNATSSGNSPKTNTGAGTGFDFGSGRTPKVPAVPNPYRMVARRDVILKAVADVMRDRKVIMDEAASKPDEGIIVSQPFTFIKGAVVSQVSLTATLT